MEKEIIISELRAKFSKDVDSLGKINPFLEFSVGKSIAKTETAKDQGVENSWKTDITLIYFDEAQISISAYDEENSSNQYMALGKIEIKSLKIAGGQLQVTLLTEKGENIGTVFGKYSIRNLPAVPLLLIKSIKCEFNKEHQFITKAKPYIKITSDEGSQATQSKKEGSSLSWSESLRIKIKQNSKIAFALLDQSNEDVIFQYESYSKQFKLQHGSKRFHVNSKNYQPLGVLEFQFETINFISKEQSTKNSQKEKKNEGQVTAISIEKIDTRLNKDINKDVFYSILLGSNIISTDLTKAVANSFTIQPKKLLYADIKENKISFILSSKTEKSDEVIGVGSIANLDSLNGEKVITLCSDSPSKEEIGAMTVNFTSKVVPSKVLTLSNVFVNFGEGSELISEADPYVVARVGNWCARTETGSSQRLTFKRSLEIKYSHEEDLILEVWDQDIDADQIKYSEKVSLSELKNHKGQHSIHLHKKEEEKAPGKITFKYQIKTNSSSHHVQIQKKQSEKKIQNKKQQIKRQEVKKEESKKQLTQREEPKKQLTQRQQHKKQQTKRIDDLRRESKRQEVKSELNREQKRQYKHSEEMSDNYRSLDKSKQSIRLPSIMDAPSNACGDKIFDKQSAATLQKSIHVYSMPKAPRFAHGPKYAGEPSYYVDTCFRPNPSKGTAFGYGNKRQFPQWLQKNMKENPSPGAYFDTSSEFRSKGPTFGISHKYYEKVLIPFEKKKESSHLARKLSPIKDIKK